MSALPFNYVSLDPAKNTIRLLGLLPGEASDHIQCEIKEVPLSQKPVYEALSYAWGDPTACVTITVENKQHAVTRSLDIALRHLRSTTEVRVLWIDALCINQKDNNEKSHQVHMMKSIFQSASRVIIWLGEEQHNSDIAMELIADMPHLEIKEPEEDDEKMRNAWEALRHLFLRSWWNRIWVVQEIAFSATDPLIGCGHKWLPWKAFEVAILTFLRLTNDPIASKTIEKFANPTAATLVLTRNRYSAGLCSWRLDKLLPATTNFNATDSRDYVYALLGMANNEDRLAVIPDYSKSVAEVYTQVAKYLLKLDVNMLCYRNAFPHRELPSWVPDWAARNHIMLWKKDLYRASGNTAPLFKISDSPPVLSIDGIKVDMIQVLETFKAVDTETIETSTIERIIRTLSRVTEEPAVSSSLVTKPDSFWRYLLAEKHFSTTENMVHMSAALDIYNTMVSASDENAVRTGWGWVPPALPMETRTEAFIEPLALSTSRTLMDERQRFFVTHGGLLGIGPYYLKEGDFVALFFGVDMPFVLRQVGGSWTQDYIAVGPAYVNGMMQGEIFNIISEETIYPHISTFNLQ
jgi:hypothetical protein